MKIKSGGLKKVIIRMIILLVLSVILGGLFAMALRYLGVGGKGGGSFFALSVYKQTATRVYIIIIFVVLLILSTVRGATKTGRAIRKSKRYARRVSKRRARKEIKRNEKRKAKAEEKQRKKRKKQNIRNSGQLLDMIDEMEGDLENSRWMTEKERDDLFPVREFDVLPKERKDGFPVYAFYDEKTRNLTVNLEKQPTHTLVVGATGSGKTTMVVNPTVQVLSNTAARPSMICLDLKGELYDAHRNALETRGYNVISLNLREPLRSAKWNPLEEIREKYREYVRAGNEIFERTDDATLSGLELVDSENRYGNVWYEYQGAAYARAADALNEVNAVREAMFDDLYAELESTLSALSPVSNVSESHSADEKGAYTLIVATALAILEDAEDGGKKGRKKPAFTLSNIHHTLTENAANSEGLKAFFEERDDRSHAKKHARMLVSLSDETLSAYVSIAHDKLSIFNDESLAAMTEKTDTPLSSIASRPTAIFICAPDENRDRLALATVFLLCIYRVLQRTADLSPSLKLPRNVYFLLDEFGNFPRIDRFDKMITAGRSRRIYFMLVVQSFAQLRSVYGNDLAEVIKSNCPTKMFLGSNEKDTCEEFSALCGNTTITQTGVSGDVAEGDLRVDSHLTTRPLIAAGELMRLNSAADYGNVIVAGIGHFPIKSKFTPSYLCPKYDIGDKTNTKKKRKTAKVATFAVGALFALTTQMLPITTPPTTAYATTLTYEGELSSDTLYPAESTENSDDVGAVIPITNTISYDEETEEFIYEIANGAGEVRANVMDGMITRGSVELTSSKNVDLTLYHDGEKVEEPKLSAITDIGDYTVEATCDANKETVLSFAIVGQSSGRFTLFIAPMKFRITSVTRDGEKIEFEKSTCDISKEGTYAIRYRPRAFKKLFVLEFTVDRTPPEIVFTNIDEDGKARGPVEIEKYDETDTITVTRNGEEVEFIPEVGFSDVGAYVVTATDGAGNTSRYEFTILTYFNGAMRTFVLVLVGVIVALIVYLIRERRRFRVR